MPDSTTRIVPGLAGLRMVGGDEQAGVGGLSPHNLGEATPNSDQGMFLESLPEGVTLRVATSNRNYELRRVGPREAEISGHPQYCPRPVRVSLHGTDWLGKPIKECYLAPGMRLEFTDLKGNAIMTSPIQKIERV